MDCTLVQLMDANNAPACLTLVQLPVGTKYLSVKEVHAKLFPESVTLPAWQRMLQQVAGRHTDPFKQPSKQLRARLTRLGGIGKRGQVPLMATLATLLKAARAVRMHDAVLHGLAALHRNEATFLFHTTTDLLAQNAVGSTTPATFHFATNLPMHVDTRAAPSLRPRERFSLDVIRPSLARAAVLTMQMQNFKSYSKADLVIGRLGTKVRESTWIYMANQVMLFLGYIHKCFGVVHPNLEHFTRVDFLAAYCASKGNRGDQGSNICKGLAVAKRVVMFWRARCPAEAAKLTELLRWLDDLSSQVRAAYPSHKRGSRVQDLELVASQLLQVLVQKKSQVEDQFWDLPSLRPEQARLLHDVALGCTMFGWLPPPRSSCVMSLCPPSFKGPCRDIDCHDDACMGNRVYVKDDEHLSLVFNHHKSQRKWGPIEYDLPDDLTKLLSLYLYKGCRVLQRHLDVQHPLMFMSRTGLPLTSGTFSHYWRTLMHEWGGPAVGPHTLRHAFVTERMRDDAVAGPSQSGAAFCMGHHLLQWGMTYNSPSLQTLHLQAQEAVDAMVKWRAARLADKAVAPVAAAVTTPVMSVEGVGGIEHAASSDSDVCSHDSDSGQSSWASSDCTSSDEALQSVDEEDSESEEDMMVDLDDD